MASMGECSRSSHIIPDNCFGAKINLEKCIECFQNIENKVVVAEKLQRLIGKLNAYKNKNTREIEVTEEFTSSIM